jgi:hypothetical protein
MAEDRLVGKARSIIAGLLPHRFEVERGAALLYEVSLDDKLQVTVNPTQPTRGQSAFETDLCIFERRAANLRIPRVVLEFKPRLSTHDVLTYSTKARKHKQVYPYLRYGLVVAGHAAVPGRFYTHNEALDFCLAVKGLPARSLAATLGRLLKSEIACSRRLQAMAFAPHGARLYRTDVRVSP